MIDKVVGCPYPIKKDPRGFFRPATGADLVRSNLSVLLNTCPGERVMYPEFGLDLKPFIYEPNDALAAQGVRTAVIEAIRNFYPAVKIEAIDVSVPKIGQNDLVTAADQERWLWISIKFADFENLKEVEDLVLQIPLGSS